MIIKLLAVAFGGSIGAVSRFLIYEPIGSKHHGNFPWTILTVNLLVIDFLWGYFARTYVSQGILNQFNFSFTSPLSCTT